ncbi:hypothetical protein M404DRAFT_1002172 [Pisolithus tinctorius Marx 270]|uniref:Uncharacterized protein n=1 Tax=Pisolithus tinctorius Marx 270 TaxID=870435 RepID=A0A0C3J0E1_PISTI|nr:hypothetical protein M404DRAFT_1002172 [Pisolithus tinctorius Marx 270]
MQLRSCAASSISRSSILDPSFPSVRECALLPCAHNGVAGQQWCPEQAAALHWHVYCAGFPAIKGRNKA